MPPVGVRPHNISRTTCCGVRPHNRFASAVAAVLLTASFVIAGTPAPSHAVGLDALEDGVQIDVVSVATFPDNSFGDAPRLNMMTTLGDRVFVVEERDGIVYELINSNEHQRTVTEFFDVGAAINTATGRQLETSNVFHGGLRSLAFHPDFADNGLLYVSAMETRPADPTNHTYLSDAAEPIDADSVVLEFRFDAETGVVDPLSYREVFRVGMPVYDHPIKQIAFDPAAPAESRGLLYIGHGDASVLSATAGGGQNNDALGKILRIDPLSTGDAPYSVPADNPFVGDPNMIDEVYSIGHRNPHQLSFTAHPDTGDRMLIVAEPGRDNAEEINLIEPGADYGWPRREGTFVHLESGGLVLGVEDLPSDEADFGFTYPAAQYTHQGPDGSSNTGEAIAGGYAVNNGSALDGQYLFADFPLAGVMLSVPVNALADAVQVVPPGSSPDVLRQATIQRVSITVDHDNDPSTPSLPRQDLRDLFDDAPTYETNRADVRFGQGPNGEIFIMSKRNNTLYLVTNSLPPVGGEPSSSTTPRYLDDQVTRLYRASLGRTPDAEGLRFWVDVRQSGTDLRSIASSFLSSPEYEARFGADPSASDFVRSLYQNVLGRDGDPSGEAFWLDQLASGVAAVDVLVAFSDSEENINRTQTTPPITDDEARLLRLYRAALGRPPDEPGLAFWVERFRSGQPLSQIAGEFRASPEFVERFGRQVDDQRFVDLLFQNVLGRDGDPTGTTFWEAQLAAGVSRDEVLVSFAESRENIVNTNTQP